MIEPIYTGEDFSSYGQHKIAIVNPTAESWTDHRFVLHFAHHYLMVWANSLEAACEEAVDWLADYAPSVFCDDYVFEEFARLMKESDKELGPLFLRVESEDDRQAREQKAQEEAETDVTCWGHNGIHFMNSAEWGIVFENPSRDELLRFIDPANPRLAKFSVKRFTVAA